MMRWTVLPCEQLLTAGLDFAALTVEAEQEAASTGGTYTAPAGPRSFEDDVHVAEQACASCPVLSACLAHATSVDVSGFAGGLPESARPSFGTVTPILDPVHAVGLVRDALVDAPRLAGKARVHPVLAEAVRAWRAAGWQREDMLAALAGVVLPDGGPVTRSTLEAALVARDMDEQGALFDA